MTPKLHEADMAFLLERPEFRRFLFRAIQTAGILEQTRASASGSDGRDLAFAEGRRSLGFDLLRDAHAGQPEAIRTRDTLSLMTMVAALSEEIQSKPEEKKRDGSDRYGDDTDGSTG